MCNIILGLNIINLLLSVSLIFTKQQKKRDNHLLILTE